MGFFENTKKEQVLFFDVKKEKEKILEIVEPLKQREAIKESGRGTSDERKRLRGKRADTEEERAQACIGEFSGRTDQDLGKALGSMRNLALGLDMPLQIVQSKGAFPELPLLITGVVTVALTAALSRLVENTTYVFTFDQTRPRKSIKRCLLLAGGAGTVAALSASLLLYSRSATEVPADLVPYLSLALFMLAESLLLASSFLGAAHRAFSIANSLNQEILDIDKALDELARHEAWLGDQLHRLLEPPSPAAPAQQLPEPEEEKDDRWWGGPPSAPAVVTPPLPPPPARRRGRPSKQPLKVVAGLLLWLLCVSGTLTAQTPRVCSVYVDATSSVSEKGRLVALAKLQNNLQTILEVQNCSSLILAYFTDEGALTPYQELKVPQRPTKIDCANAPIKGKALPMESVRKTLQKKATAECEVEQENASHRNTIRTQTFLADVAKNLQPPVEFPKTGTCLYSLVKHNLDRSVLGIYVTDAEESCAVETLRKAKSHPGLLFLILVPSKGNVRYRGDEALRRIPEWQRAFPDLQYVLYTEVDGFWKQPVPAPATTKQEAR